MNNSKTPLTLAVALALGMSPALADEPVKLPDVEVEAADAQAGLDTPPGVVILDADKTKGALPADGGEWLLSVPGVSGVKMSAHGVDPVIRGQKHNQLNVLIDGAHVHGAGPNRMDPPTSYASMDAYDTVTVIKGVHSLTYAPGGPGGTVLFERGVPEFAPGIPYRATASASFSSNGSMRGLNLNGAMGDERGWLRVDAASRRAGDYEDGNGDTVRSGYKDKNAGVEFGLNLAGGGVLKVHASANRADDIRFGGAMMDGVLADNDSLRVSAKDISLGAWRWNLQAYRVEAAHVMDNYSLRVNNMMWAMADTTSDTDGARLFTDIPLAGGSLRLGLDLQSNRREALRFMGPPGQDPRMLQSVLLPDVENDQIGLVAEYQGQLDAATRYTAGIRYDRGESDANDVLRKPSMMSPAMLYTRYYGAGDFDFDESHLGLLLRMERELSSDTTIYAAASRSARDADAVERYMAANHMQSPMRWIGNPFLDSESHRQLNVGWKYTRARYEVSADVYYDDVQDYILRDRAHGQDGILQSDNATVYRNVDARLYGAELSLRYAMTDAWSMNADLAYTRGHNREDNRPLAQIPPLETRLSLDYAANTWSAGAEIRAVAKQTRVDDNPMTGSGLDAGETPGFGLLNLYGATELGKRGELRIGVDNVFDRAYAEHLNKPNAYDPVQLQVNEPGRSWWLRASVEF